MKNTGNRYFPDADQKEEILRDAMEKLPMAVVLHFKEKNSQGVYMAAKSMTSTPPWHHVKVSMDLVESLPLGDDPEDSETQIGGCLLGVGNSSELASLADLYRDIFQSEVSAFGAYKKVTEETRKSLAEYLNEDYRSLEYQIPMRVEFVLITYANHVLEMVKFQPDGDYHSEIGFAIVGGHFPVRGLSLRECARRRLEKKYKVKPPTMKEAAALAEEVLSRDPRKFPFDFTSILQF